MIPLSPFSPSAEFAVITEPAAVYTGPPSTRSTIPLASAARARKGRTRSHPALT